MWHYQIHSPTSFKLKPLLALPQDLYVTRWEWTQLVGPNTDWQNWVTVLAVDGLEPGGAAGVRRGVAETVERHSEGFGLQYVPDGRDRAHHHQQHGHATDDILNHLLPNRHRQLLLGRRAQEKTAREQEAQRCAQECTTQRNAVFEERLCERINEWVTLWWWVVDYFRQATQQQDA